MDWTIHYTVTSFIIFLVEKDLNTGILVAKAEALTIQGQRCLGYLDLKTKTNLQSLRVLGTSMQYFPEGDCNNTVPDEDLRVLNLPNLRYLAFKHNNLLKMPDVTGMGRLSSLAVQNNFFTAIPGKPFINNRLSLINLSRNKLVQAPDLEGACETVSNFNLNSNKLTHLPHNYFKGCMKLKIVSLNGNQITAFPNFAPIGSSLTTITISNNRLNETIAKDAIATHPNLTKFWLQDNMMPAFILSFCNLTKPMDFNSARNPFVSVENPYRDCIASIGTLPKLKFNLTETEFLPCDEKICWMKQHGFDKENVTRGDCPDGREWKYVTQEELCPGK